MAPYRFSKKSKSLKKSIKRNKSASAQARQLARTNARIDSLQLKIQDTKAVYGLHLESAPDALAPLTNYACVPLCPTLVGTGAYAVWSNCFSDDTNAYEAQRVRLGRMFLKMGFYAGNEPGPNSFSVFHVKLHEDSADQLIDDAGNDLSGIISNKHYITGHSTDITSGIGSHVMLNPKFFRIIKKWNFTLSNRSAAGGSPYVGETHPSAFMKNFEYFFPLNYKIGSDQDDWRTQTALDSTPAHMRNFILIFCDNSSLDGQNPSWRIVAQCNASA